jgi:hypothetical protein
MRSTVNIQESGAVDCVIWEDTALGACLVRTIERRIGPPRYPRTFFIKFARWPLSSNGSLSYLGINRADPKAHAREVVAPTSGKRKREIVEGRNKHK